MTEMIERVARAICVADGVEPDFPLPQQQGEKLTPQWMDYLGLARVAIEAMREPTDEMLAAAANEKLYDRPEIAVLKGPARQRAKMIVRFQAMIDEAQK